MQVTDLPFLSPTFPSPLSQIKKFTGSCSLPECINPLSEKDFSELHYIYCLVYLELHFDMMAVHGEKLEISEKKNIVGDNRPLNSESSQWP